MFDCLDLVSAQVFMQIGTIVFSLDRIVKPSFREVLSD